MPEAQKDDRFDDGEFENRIIGREQIFGGKEEEEESVEGYRDTNIVDEGSVEVSLAWRPVSVVVKIKRLQKK